MNSGDVNYFYPGQVAVRWQNADNFYGFRWSVDSTLPWKKKFVKVLNGGESLLINNSGNNPEANTWYTFITKWYNTDFDIKLIGGNENFEESGIDSDINLPGRIGFYNLVAYKGIDYIYIRQNTEVTPTVSFEE